MSYTQHTAIATLTLNSSTTIDEIVKDLYDTLMQENDNEIPYPFPIAYDEFCEDLPNYFEFNGEELQIKLDTEEINCNSEVFDYITDYLAKRMTSKFMRVIYITYDSREGLSGDCTYYDSQGNFIDVEAMLTSR